MPFGKIRLDPADVLFSKYIRKRDGYRCQRCWTFYEDGKGLACMHYWSRRHEGTRYEPDNCLAGCVGCHQALDSDKQGEFSVLMRKRLGEARFKSLTVQAQTYCRKDRKLALLAIKTLIKQDEATSKKSQ